MKDYAKSIAMVVATLLSAIVAALTGDNNVTVVEWLNVGVLVLGAISVGIVPDLDAGIAKYAKAIIAFMSAVLVLGMSLVEGGLTMGEWLQLAIAGLGALGVTASPGPTHPANYSVRSA